MLKKFITRQPGWDTYYPYLMSDVAVAALANNLAGKFAAAREALGPRYCLHVANSTPRISDRRPGLLQDQAS